VLLERRKKDFRAPRPRVAKTFARGGASTHVAAGAMSTHDRASPRGSPIASLAPGPPSPARRVQNDLAVLDTFQALLLELESEFKREAQQQSWEQCRDHWRRRVSLLSTYAPDVPEQLARILLGETRGAETRRFPLPTPPLRDLLARPVFPQKKSVVFPKHAETY
jgi:hypothetical protein